MNTSRINKLQEKTEAIIKKLNLLIDNDINKLEDAKRKAYLELNTLPDEGKITDAYGDYFKDLVNDLFSEFNFQFVPHFFGEGRDRIYVDTDISLSANGVTKTVTSEEPYLACFSKEDFTELFLNLLSCKKTDYNAIKIINYLKSIFLKLAKAQPNAQDAKAIENKLNKIFKELTSQHVQLKEKISTMHKEETRIKKECNNLYDQIKMLKNLKEMSPVYAINERPIFKDYIMTALEEEMSNGFEDLGCKDNDFEENLKAAKEGSKNYLDVYILSLIKEYMQNSEKEINL